MSQGNRAPNQTDKMLEEISEMSKDVAAFSANVPVSTDAHVLLHKLVALTRKQNELLDLYGRRFWAMNSDIRQLKYPSQKDGE